MKPNQPNQSSPAPSSTNGMLWPRMFSFGQPLRLPSTSAIARPAAPALMCTTVPPAKSSAKKCPCELGISDRFSQPYPSNTQCATGA